MDADGRIYLGTHNLGLFHHSSFLAGGAAAAAGDMKVANGVPTFISNHSGHYKPSTQHVINVVNELLDRGVPLKLDMPISLAGWTPALVITLERLGEQDEDLGRRLGLGRTAEPATELKAPA